MRTPPTNRFLQSFITVTSVVLIATLAISYWQQPLQGDLTRIGFYSERDYGPRIHPSGQPIAATGSTVHEPSFWVLGDSFSRGNAWQSVLSQNHQLHSQTFHYDNIGCINQWIEQASQHPNIKTVVLQVAQISLLSRFSKPKDCSPKPDKPIVVLAKPSITTSAQAFQPSRDWRIKHSLWTQFNAWRLTSSHSVTIQDSQVANSPLKPQCANFSNLRGDRLLYQTGSLDHPKKTVATYTTAAAHLKTLQMRLQTKGKQLLLVVVPDKFSAYQVCIADPAVDGGTEAVSSCKFFAPQGIPCVNLMPMIQTQRLTTPDLYLPNDTHFSQAGYRLMADAMLPYLR